MPNLALVFAHPSYYQYKILYILTSPNYHNFLGGGSSYKLKNWLLFFVKCGKTHFLFNMTFVVRWIHKEKRSILLTGIVLFSVDKDISWNNNDFGVTKYCTKLIKSSTIKRHSLWIFKIFGMQMKLFSHFSYFFY